MKTKNNQVPATTTKCFQRHIDNGSDLGNIQNTPSTRFSAQRLRYWEGEGIKNTSGSVEAEMADWLMIVLRALGRQDPSPERVGVTVSDWLGGEQRR